MRLHRWARYGIGTAVIPLLLTGCGPSGSNVATPTAVTSPASGAATSGTAAPATAPAAGAPLSAVIAWIHAGTTVDVSKFHTATTSDGTLNDLGPDVAFVSPTKKIECMTDDRAAPSPTGLSCLVQMDNPPARPDDNHGNWVGGWVDFPGSTLGIGSLHGDPGQFTSGTGNTLAYGSRITFGGYDCRMDSSGLVCADQTAGSGVQVSSGGAVPFGCLSKATTPEHGISYACGAASTTTIDTARCHSGDLALDALIGAQGSTTSQTFYIRLTNTSTQACTLLGYPGADLLDHNGHPLGMTSAHSSGNDPSAQTLSPNAASAAAIRFTDTGTGCPDSSRAAGVQIIPPDETQPLSATIRNLYGNGAAALCPASLTLTVDPMTDGNTIPHR
ncbi:MAG: hypothetical protein JWN03_7476 [Nocardia sp.]|uniref:DUF4232 domain-containing protein n=1 Tax=Nocardia sp. TaxID=1821 RepID=UPI002626DDA1|nr:DUF4232 domain-containing protein [Nocardia sp.]MCU1647201.1 hypothetical protein [Nocardia sp.]